MSTKQIPVNSFSNHSLNNFQGEAEEALFSKLHEKILHLQISENVSLNNKYVHLT